MKKLFISLALVVLSFDMSSAAPRFKSLSNKYGKTTIQVEIPASDRDASHGLSIDHVKLYNNGELLKANKVDALWGENTTIILEFKKLTVFEDCTLCFTVNGEPFIIDIQSIMKR